MRDMCQETMEEGLMGRPRVLDNGKAEHLHSERRGRNYKPEHDNQIAVVRIESPLFGHHNVTVHYEKKYWRGGVTPYATVFCVEGFRATADSRTANFFMRKLEKQIGMECEGVVESIKRAEGREKMKRPEANFYTSKYRFKACPKCNGDQRVAYMEGDAVYHCIQCGKDEYPQGLTIEQAASEWARDNWAPFSGPHLDKRMPEWYGYQ